MSNTHESGGGDWIQVFTRKTRRLQRQSPIITQLPDELCDLILQFTCPTECGPICQLWPDAKSRMKRLQRKRTDIHICADCEILYPTVTAYAKIGKAKMICTQCADNYFECYRGCGTMLVEEGIMCPDCADYFSDLGDDYRRDMYGWF